MHSAKHCSCLDNELELSKRTKLLEEPLLASVDELDFAEDELFFDEDWALLQEEGLDGSPPLRSEDDSAMELLVSFSGLTKLLLSSSPQATNKNAIASAKTRVMNPRPLAKDDWPRVTGKDDVNNSFFILDKFAMTCFITTPKRLS